MTKVHTYLALPVMFASLSACATLGTNVAGDFSCRAPKGGCAPTNVIDAAATAASSTIVSGRHAPRVRAGIASGDISRTGERTLRIVFPAHIDNQGTLRDEAVAWAVVEQSEWAAAFRRSPSEANQSVDSPLRQILKHRRQPDDKPQFGPLPADGITSETVPETVSDSPYSDALLFPLVSPLVLPSTAREAIAGAIAPAVEGFDMSPPPHVRTPRSSDNAQLQNYPTLEAIEAAKAKSKTSADVPLRDPR